MGLVRPGKSLMLFKDWFNLKFDVSFQSLTKVVSGWILFFNQFIESSKSMT